MAGNGYYFDSTFDQDPCHDPVVTNPATRTITDNTGDSFTPPPVDQHDEYRGPVAFRPAYGSTRADC